MKRRSDWTAKEIADCKRAFWEATIWKALRRSAERIREGNLPLERDRELAALHLDAASAREWQAIKTAGRVKMLAHQAEYLHDKLRMPLDRAAAIVAGREIKPDSVRKAVDRLRKSRRERRKRGQMQF